MASLSFWNMSERKMIYLCLAHMSEAGIEQKYVKEAFDTNWVVPLGPNVNGFEEDLKKFVNHRDYKCKFELFRYLSEYAGIVRNDGRDFRIHS